MNEIISNELRRPPRLCRGDTIGIVLPAGPLYKEENFVSGVRLLREMGFEVKHSRDLTRCCGYLAGSDKERTAEFTELWADPEVKAVMAARGGYGSLRIVSGLPMELFHANPKMLIGFSDITVLLTAFLIRAKLITFHGPTVTTLTRSDQETVRSFFSTLRGEAPLRVKPRGLEILKSGAARGVLLGGNLTTLVHLLGTKFENPWRRVILFLEDVNEQPYRIDRMLTQLREAGRLSLVSGVILGHFHECGDEELIWSRALEVLQDLDIPLWANFPVGHGAENWTMPLGVEVVMDDSSGVLRFCSPCFGE